MLAGIIVAYVALVVRLVGVYRVCVVVVLFGFCVGQGVWNVSEAELWASQCVCRPQPLSVPVVVLPLVLVVT